MVTDTYHNYNDIKAPFGLFLLLCKWDLSNTPSEDDKSNGMTTRCKNSICVA